MTYRPWCPKCGNVLYLDTVQHPPVVACTCGFRLVDNNHIRNLVIVQQRELAEGPLPEPTPPPPKPEPIIDPERVAAALASLKLRLNPDPEPTPTQRRRGATHPVRCAVCDEVLFRRQCEVKTGGPFFCGREHQNQWKRDHPAGCVRKVS